MSTTFFERIDLLRRMVGRETIQATVEVDQVYAHYQHEHLEFRHPRGGRAKYLEAPLYDHYRDYLSEYARDVLRDGGTRALERAAEHLSDQVEVEAPREFGDLMRSGHPSVTKDGAVVFDRAPKVGRLSESDLRAKARLRHLPPELIGYIWWKVMRHTEPPPHLRGRHG